MTQPRAADDFATIRARMNELARDQMRSAAPNAPPTPRHPEPAPGERERRLQDRREGKPPRWVPTIFAKTIK